MTQEELIQENAKLNARLQKAVTVFNEQKATIQRLTEERDAAIAKTKDAEGQDQLFFEQQSEIEALKSELDGRVKQYDELDVLNSETEAKLKESEAANEKLNARLAKASEEYEKLKEVNGILLKRNEATVQFISKIQDDCVEVLKQMQQNKAQ